MMTPSRIAVEYCFQGSVWAVYMWVAYPFCSLALLLHLRVYEWMQSRRGKHRTA